MAAATMAGLDAHRLEEKKLEYFSSINSMASKIMQEREKIKAKHGSAWTQMSPAEQDQAIDTCMMDPHIRARYAMHRVDRDEVVCYPKLLIQTGQKIVHFGDEDLTWQDEHSGPFSWETKSQLEFSLIAGPVDQGVLASLADSKSTKVSHSGQVSKSTPATKVSGSEGLLRRPEEESSFWKISAERSRLEGEQTSLTPSQIKSLEKGEKSLPSYLRQETSVINAPAKEPEVADHHPPPASSRSIKQRAPKPPAPPPPIPIAVTTTPASISMAPSPVPPVRVPQASWERGQSTLPSVGLTVDEVFPKPPSFSNKTPNPSNKTPNFPTGLEREREAEDPSALATSPTFAQFNTSNSILKTGFDFLDNW